MMTLVTWLLYLLPVLLLVAAWQTLTRRWVLRLWWAPVFLLSAVLTYARFIEPYRLQLHSHDIATSALAASAADPKTLKIALISDLHYGKFGQKMPLWRIQRLINTAKPDLVLIAGDLTYKADIIDFRKFFSELTGFEAPVFVVTGNHDYDAQDSTYVEFVKQTMSRFGAQVLDNRSIRFQHQGDSVQLTGLADLWHGPQLLDFARVPKDADIQLVLAHNPDHFAKLPANTTVDLGLSGHTHGGQFYLPYMSQYLSPTEGGFLEGRYSVNGYQVFVSAGVGTSILPLRFLVPPRVDLINLQYL